MDNSLITIIIAILVIFFQVYSDKKKKEAKRQAELKKQVSTQETSTTESLHSSPFDFISDLINDSEIEINKSGIETIGRETEINDNVAEINNRGGVVAAGKVRYSPVYSGMSAESVENLNLSTQKSVAESGREGILFTPDKEFVQTEGNKGEAGLHHSLDPRLLVLYSEIMKPKFTL